MNAPTKRWKRVVPLALLSILLLAGTGWWVQRAKHADAPLTLYGNVDIREVQLGFRQSGRLAEMMFEEGDRVAPGVPLARIDARPYTEGLALADATLAGARATLDKMRSGLRPQEIAQAEEALRKAQAAAREAERNHTRQTELLASGAASQRTLDQATATRDQARAAVQAARAALSQAREGFRAEDIAAAEAGLAAAAAARAQAATALADTVLEAPDAGTISARVREPGSMLASGSPVYTLSLDRPVYVRAWASEPELGRVAPGTRVRVHTDGSRRTYSGQIGFVSPRAEFTPKTVETADLRTDLVYRLRIIVEDADAQLRQGMPVTIELGPAGGGA